MTALFEQAKELARIRHIRLEADKEAGPEKVTPYRKATAFVREGILLDPNRRVAAVWKKTAHDRAMLNFDAKTSLWDAGDGPGIISDWNGPFLLRVLRGPDIGAVIEVDAVEYIFARGDYQRNPNNHRFEPVDDSEPLRGPILPAGFPSDIRKARAIAGKALKKEPAELSLPDLLAFFSKRKDFFEIAK